MKKTYLATSILALSLAACPVTVQADVTNKTRDGYISAVQGKRVVFIPMSMTTDLTLTWYAFLKRQADELSYTVDVRDPNWSAEAGARALTQAIGEKPDLIVLQNPDVQAYARLIKRAQKAGIKIIQLNMESLAQSDAYVGADWFGIGYEAGQAVASKCGAANAPSNKVALVSGVPTAPVDLFQMAGFKKALSDSGQNINIVSEQSAGYDPSKARGITSSVLQQNPDLCAAFGIWDGQDAGIGAAVKEAKKDEQVFVVTSGGGASTSCENVADGKFDLFIKYDARMQGQALNTLVSTLLQSDRKAGAEKLVYYGPNYAVTKENLTPSSCFVVEDNS